MGQPNEPSMEEILSSIKRIIAEDSDSLTPAARRSPAPAPEPDEQHDVLELTDTFGEPETMPATEPERDPEPTSAEEAPAIAMAPVAPLARSTPAEPMPHPLLSATSEQATRQALAALSRMVVKPEDPAADNTLEGLVRDMLRPMLKDWLDAHLPGIVQATVDREVARISGR